MKIIMLLWGVMLFNGLLYAQGNDSNNIEKFCGKWKGSLEWNRPGKTKQTFSMHLNVQKTSSAGVYTWQMNYGDSGKDIRSYTLRPINASIGHWVIDENNGIVLDNYLMADCLSGAFSVMGNTIADSYCLENGQMKVSFISFRLSDKNTTGAGTDVSPSVDSYKITGTQQGWLQKQPD